MDNQTVILEAQKIIEDWAVTRSIRQVVRGGVTRAPDLLQWVTPPCEKDLALWFCWLVLDFITDYWCVAAPDEKVRHRRDATHRYGRQCEQEINRLLALAVSGLSPKSRRGLAAEIVEHTASSLRNTIASIERDGDSPLVRVVLHNLEATFTRAQSGGIPDSKPWNKPAPGCYPVIAENATVKSVRDLSWGRSQPL